jgi:hypothetical protein
VSLSLLFFLIIKQKSKGEWGEISVIIRILLQKTKMKILKSGAHIYFLESEKLISKKVDQKLI